MTSSTAKPTTTPSSSSSSSSWFSMLWEGLTSSSSALLSGVRVNHVIITGTSVLVSVGVMTLIYKAIKRRRRGIDQANLSRCFSLTRDQIERLWGHYDTMNTGELDYEQIRLLIQAVLSSMSRQHMLAAQYVDKMFEEYTDNDTRQQAERAIKELVYELNRHSQVVYEELKPRLGFYSHGRVSKLELTALFGLYLEKKIETTFNEHLS